MILKLSHFKIPGHLSECFREQRHNKAYEVTGSPNSRYEEFTYQTSFARTRNEKLEPKKPDALAGYRTVIFSHVIFQTFEEVFLLI